MDPLVTTYNKWLAQFDYFISQHRKQFSLREPKGHHLLEILQIRTSINVDKSGFYVVQKLVWLRLVQNLHPNLKPTQPLEKTSMGPLSAYYNHNIKQSLTEDRRGGMDTSGVVTGKQQPAVVWSNVWQTGIFSPKLTSLQRSIKQSTAYFGFGDFVTMIMDNFLNCKAEMSQENTTHLSFPSPKKNYRIDIGKRLQLL